MKTVSLRTWARRTITRLLTNRPEAPAPDPERPLSQINNRLPHPQPALLARLRRSWEQAWPLHVCLIFSLVLLPFVRSVRADGDPCNCPEAVNGACGCAFEGDLCNGDGACVPPPEPCPCGGTLCACGNDPSICNGNTDQCTACDCEGNACSCANKAVCGGDANYCTQYACSCSVVVDGGLCLCTANANCDNASDPAFCQAAAQWLVKPTASKNNIEEWTFLTEDIHLADEGNPEDVRHVLEYKLTALPQANQLPVPGAASQDIFFTLELRDVAYYVSDPDNGMVLEAISTQIGFSASNPKIAQKNQIQSSVNFENSTPIVGNWVIGLQGVVNLVRFDPNDPETVAQLTITLGAVLARVWPQGQENVIPHSTGGFVVPANGEMPEALWFEGMEYAANPNRVPVIISNLIEGAMLEYED